MATYAGPVQPTPTSTPPPNGGLPMQIGGSRSFSSYTPFAAYGTFQDFYNAMAQQAIQTNSGTITDPYSLWAKTQQAGGVPSWWNAPGGQLSQAGITDLEKAQKDIQAAQQYSNTDPRSAALYHQAWGLQDQGYGTMFQAGTAPPTSGSPSAPPSGNGQSVGTPGSVTLNGGPVNSGVTLTPNSNGIFGGQQGGTAGGLPSGTGGGTSSTLGGTTLGSAGLGSFSGTGPNGGPSYQDILNGYTQLMNQANTAGQNAQSQYNSLLGTVQGQISGIDASQRQAIADQYAQASGAAQQSDISRGLGNTTVVDSTQRGLTLDETKANIALSNQMAQLQAGYSAQLGGAGIQAGLGGANLAASLGSQGINAATGLYGSNMQTLLAQQGLANQQAQFAAAQRANQPFSGSIVQGAAPGFTPASTASMLPDEGANSYGGQPGSYSDAGYAAPPADPYIAMSGSMPKDWQPFGSGGGGAPAASEGMGSGGGYGAYASANPMNAATAPGGQGGISAVGSVMM